MPSEPLYHSKLDAKTNALRQIHTLCNAALDGGCDDWRLIKKIRQIASANWPLSNNATQEGTAKREPGTLVIALFEFLEIIGL